MVDILKLNIPSGTQRLLHKHGIRTLKALTKICRRELTDIPKLHPKTADLIEKALSDRGLSLAEDPWGPYTCARHDKPRGDTNLESLFLCDDCAANFKDNAFIGKEPEYVGPNVGGHCSHCNQTLENVCLRQWFLCAVCTRVVKSLGRSVVADNYVQEWWLENVKPDFPHLDLRLTDPPEPRSYADRSSQVKKSEVDFTCFNTKSNKDIFGIEIKTGRAHIRGSSIGSKMGQFQLDNSDCDDILAVAHREQLPIYLAHAQVIDRASPPTIYYAGVGLWWTDLFSMRDHFTGSRMRPRETRSAGYYNIDMFHDMDLFIEHLRDNGPKKYKARLKSEGIPKLYW